MRVLVAMTCRPDLRPPWPARAHVLPMTLTRLSAADAAALAGHMAGGKPLSPEVAETVVARADGVPLFVEELTRTVLASDFLSEEDGAWRLAGPMPPIAVPVSLQDTLMAKLDRLGAHKDIAQTGAALGRSFCHDVLAAVGGHDPAALATGLEALVAEDLVLRRGLPPDATYVFRQSIVQEVAYQSLLRSRRQALHRRIAEVLERDFPAIADSDPAELARHLTAAGLEGRALAHTRRAAAIDRSAMAEALSHADAALAALARLRETPENRLLEIDLLSMRALALSATLGFFDPAVETALLRARAAARELKRPDLEARVLVSLYAHNTSRDRLGEARRIGAELTPPVRAAGQRPAALRRLPQRRDRRQRDRRRGRRAQPSRTRAGGARRHGRAGGRLDGGAGPRSRRLDPARALALHAGLPRTGGGGAARRPRARRGHRPPDERGLRAVGVGGAVHAAMRDREALEALSARAAALAETKGFQAWRVCAAIYHGLALAKLGRVREGVAVAERGIALGHRMWRRGPSTFFLVAIAELYLAAGRHGDALDAVAQGLERIAAFGGGSFTAELHRLRGSILFDRVAEAEPAEAAELADKALAALDRALAIAREGGTLGWELRAALAKADILAERGRGAEARALLREVRDRFTEGAGTPDPEAARAWLEPAAVSAE